VSKITNLHSAFNAPVEGSVDLLIIAGEHSGDEHAAAMVRNLRAANPSLNIYAIGGGELKAAGAKLLFDLTEASVVGFFEVLKHYGFFKRIFSETLNWIREHKPKAVCFVDYPGFNLRLAKALYEEKLAHKAGGAIRLLYYISPQIWAWKAKRRFAMAKYLDSLAVIFPFEVACYKDTDLDVQFVGHPFIDKHFHNNILYDKNGRVLLLPGSRKAAVKRIFPLMLDAFLRLKRTMPDEKAVVLYPTPFLHNILKDILETDFPTLVDQVSFLRSDEMVTAKAVLMSSGTISLQCSIEGVPGVVVYKANLFTYLLGRMLIKIPYLGIANILLNKGMYPEYIQGKATTKALSTELEKAIKDAKNNLRVKGLSDQIKELLACKKAKFSVHQWVLDQLNKVFIG